MKVLSWNINRNRGGSADAAREIVNAVTAHEPDVVLLQEVLLDEAFSRPLLEALSDAELPGIIGTPQREVPFVKRYGCVVAARWPVTALELAPPDFAGAEQWTHLVCAARVGHEIPFTAVSVHMPNGSGNGWAKAEAFQHLANILDNYRDAPIVVGGDFNEPARFTATGIESFGFTEGDPDSTWTRKGRGATKTTGRYREWEQSVRAILGPLPAHHLRRVAPENGLGVVTHEVRGGGPDAGRCFDHILVSGDFRDARLGADHGVRAADENGVRRSDHSIVWVDARYGAT